VVSNAGEAVASAVAPAVAATASPDAFFANLDEGSPLEPETERETDLAQSSELDSSPGASSAESQLGGPPGMPAVSPAVAGNVAESPSKGVGSARRSMIMKHAKQLVA